MAVKRIKIERETKDTTTLYQVIGAIEYVYGVHAVKDIILDLAEMLMLPYVAALNGGTQKELERAILQAEDRTLQYIRRSRRYWSGVSEEVTEDPGSLPTPDKANPSTSELLRDDEDYFLDDGINREEIDC